MEPIAIVGMACRYPGARSPQELWENALAQRRAFRTIPEERLRVADYDDPEDRISTVTAAVIEDYHFDRERFRVSAQTYRTADLSHWLALDVATQALEDAGLVDAGEDLRGKTAVFLGNTLTGEFSRANTLRLRWPYVRRVLHSVLNDDAAGMPRENQDRFLERVEALYKAPFPATGDESLAGGLSNTIAGRICNYHDLKGGGYTVDGACASSLLAVTNACAALESGDADVALAGGVDLSIDPFELAGFSVLGALAKDKMRVYDAASSGFLPGEGSGFAVLMRYAEALAQGRHVYALIKGWGISSDGHGGIARPEAAGQALALERAYRKAGYRADTVVYFEGHGTGTAVGDATELQAIARVRRKANANATPAAIGSIKANIGHTKAAAGIAGLLKATLAVHSQILPPTTGCDSPHRELLGETPALRILKQGGIWPSDVPLRASVSAMGFGGINAHLTLEGSAGHRRTTITVAEDAQLRAPQDCELFLFAACSHTELTQQVAHFSRFAARLSMSELTDLAAHLASLQDHSFIRLAVCANTPARLGIALCKANQWLEEGVIKRFDAEAGLFLGSGDSVPAIGYLFSGQASPVYGAHQTWNGRFAFLHDLYCQANLPVTPSHGTADAQPCIVAASLAGLRVMDYFGIAASVAVGHSLGEITALYWGGIVSEEAALRIATARGKAMAGVQGAEGAMAAIEANPAVVHALLNGSGVQIAALNSPLQTVVSGEVAGVELIIGRSRSQGIEAKRLNVSHAFHSRLLAGARPALMECLSRETFSTPSRRILSTITGQPLPDAMGIEELLCRQLEHPVHFEQALSQASADCDLWIEVGPGQVLTGIARQCIGTPILPLDSGGSSFEGLLKAIGAAYALGAKVQCDQLFAGRFFRAFNPEWNPTFFANPCEMPPAHVLPDRRPTVVKPALPEANAIPSSHSALAVLQSLIAARTELPESIVRPECSLLRDLHLNSISVSQILVEAAQRLNIRTPPGIVDYSLLTVAEAADALEQHRLSPQSSEEYERLTGIAAWTRVFDVVWVKQPSRRPRAESFTEWSLVALGASPLAELLRATCAAKTSAVPCMMLVAPAGMERSSLQPLREAVQAALRDKVKRLVLVQEGGSLAPFLRSAALEFPRVQVSIVDVPNGHPRATEWVLSELDTASGFLEVRYSAAGDRYERRLKLLKDTGERRAELSPDDILLVSGGGKGIGAECAFALAKKSGAKLAILGRSHPEQSAELATNLARIRDAGVDCHYYVADVSHAESVNMAVSQIRSCLGDPTVILHAAGINNPQSLATLDRESLERTLAPKVDGLQNILAAADSNCLRIVCAFGSIIAQAGLRGEADYALANEWMARSLEAWSGSHPGRHCLTIDWSVWAGAGMGERLGTLDSLLNSGITPIPIEEGVAVLERLLSMADAPSRTVVAGRVGEMATLRHDDVALPFLRFLEEPKLFTPGVELIVEAILQRESDPYLDEHVFEGERLLPAVVGLEAMAQVASALVEPGQAIRFEAVEFLRPIAVRDGQKVRLRLASLAQPDGSVKAAIRCDQTGFAVDHFRAVCRFTNEHASPAAPLRQPGTGPPVPIGIVGALYNGILFHTGRFQRIQRYFEIRARSAEAEIATASNSLWFGWHFPQQLLLGDPAVRDAALHSIQVCIPRATILPVGVDRISILSTTRTGPVYCRSREIAREGKLFTYNFEIVDQQGTLLETWDGVRLQAFEKQTTGAKSWPAALLASHMERELSDRAEGIDLRLSFESTPSLDRGGRHDAMVRSFGFNSEDVYRRADGKPEIKTGGSSITFSHLPEISMAVLCTGLVGCDLVSVQEREPALWRQMLGQVRYSVAGFLSRSEGDSEDTASSRVWAAMECLKKAGASSGETLLFENRRDDWITFTAGPFSVATLAVNIQGVPGAVVVGVLTRRANAELRIPACSGV